MVINFIQDFIILRHTLIKALMLIPETSKDFQFLVKYFSVILRKTIIIELDLKSQEVFSYFCIYRFVNERW